MLPILAAEMTEDQAVGLIAILASMFAVFAIVGVVFYILQVIAYWKIFTKAGQAGWKSLIPFYSTFIEFKISWNGMFFWIYLALVCVSGFLGSLLSDGETGGFLSVVCLLIMIAAIVIGIIQNYKLAQAFGYGIGFTVGLVLLNSIFMLILGFGSSEYIGPEGDPSLRDW